MSPGVWMIFVKPGASDMAGPAGHAAGNLRIVFPEILQATAGECCHPGLDIGSRQLGC